MSRIVALSLTLKLELASRLARADFYHGLEAMLRTGLGDVLAESPDCVVVIGADDPECVMTTTTDLKSLLDPAGEISIVWTNEDVLEVRPDLTREQAIAVLQRSLRDHDAGIGINWHTLESTAEELFGVEPEESTMTTD